MNGLGESEIPEEEVDELLDVMGILGAPTDFQFFDNFGKHLGGRDDCFEPHLLALLRRTDLTDDQKLAASWGLLHGARRRKNQAAFRRYVEELKTRFPDHPLTDLMRAESIARDAATARELREALTLAHRSNQELRNSATLMTTIGIVLDLIDLDPPDKKTLLGDADSLIAEAFKGCGDAPYPKLFSFRSRAEAENGLYSDALRSLDRAIESEDSRRKDYALRIGDYQAIRAKVIFERELTRMAETQAAALAEMQDAKREMLTVLGLLAAVVALIASSTQIGEHMALTEAARYSLVMAGAILLVFTGYQFIFARRGVWREGVAACVAAAMITFPLAF